MDIDALASATVGAQTGKLQMAAAAKMLQMNADQEANIAELIDQAQKSAQRLANVAAGVGQMVDVAV
jgi:hypothetical protein